MLSGLIIFIALSENRKPAENDGVALEKEGIVQVNCRSHSQEWVCPVAPLGCRSHGKPCMGDISCSSQHSSPKMPGLELWGVAVGARDHRQDHAAPSASSCSQNVKH